MIEMIASGIVDLMIRKSKISVQESAVYQYGYELLLSSILTGIITIIVGAMASCLHFMWLQMILHLQRI